MGGFPTSGGGTGLGNATSIQGVPVLAIPPSPANTLGFNGDEWQPIDVVSLLTYTNPLTVTTIDDIQYLTISLGGGLEVSGASLGVKTGSGLEISGSSVAVKPGSGIALSGGSVVADFGTVAGKVCEGNYATDTRTPTDGSVTAAKMAASAVDLASSTVTGALPVAHGGTGGTTAATARANLGVSQRVTAGSATVVLGARRYMTPQGTISADPVPLILLDRAATLDALVFCAVTAPGVGQTVTATLVKSADYGATWSDTASHVELSGAGKYDVDNTPIAGAGAEMYALAVDASVGSAAAGVTASFSVTR